MSIVAEDIQSDTDSDNDEESDENDDENDDNDEENMKESETIESEETKKYQMNVIDLYEWHLDSDDKLLTLINDKLRQSESKKERSDEDVQLELNTKYLELKKIKDTTGVDFIERWKTLRAKLMENVDTVSVSVLARIKQKIQEHRKQIKKTKESTQLASYKAIAAGLFAAAAGYIGVSQYEKNMVSSYKDDFNDFKSILYALEGQYPQNGFKIHDWMNEINRSKPQGEDEHAKVVRTMQNKIADVRDDNWPLSDKQTSSLDNYISSYETMEMFLVEYKKTDILGNIEEAALKWKKKEFDILTGNVDVMTSDYQDNLRKTYPYAGLRNYSSGAAVCFIDNYVEPFFQSQQVGEAKDLRMVARPSYTEAMSGTERRVGWMAVSIQYKQPQLTLIRRLGVVEEGGPKIIENGPYEIVPTQLLVTETNQTVINQYKAAFGEEIVWLVAGCSWGKILRRSAAIDPTFLDLSTNEISMQLFNSKKLPAYKKYPEFQQSMEKWVTALLGDVEIGPGANDKWNISLRVELDNSSAIKRVKIAEELSTDQIWGVWTTWNTVRNTFGYERSLGTMSTEPPHTWKQGDLYMPKTTVEDGGNFNTQSSLWHSMYVNSLFITSLNSVKMPLAGSFGPNALQWVVDMVKNFDSSVLTAPSASKSVKAILDQKQTLKRSMKGKNESQAESVYLENKLGWYEANYTKWRVRELMYRKAKKLSKSNPVQEPLRYFLGGEGRQISQSHANEILEITFPSFEPMDEPRYGFSEWKLDAIKKSSSMSPSSMAALEKYFFTAKSIVNMEISDPMKSIMNAFTNPYAMQYLDLNGITHVVWVLPEFMQDKNSKLKKVIVRDGLTMNERMTARTLGFEYESQLDKMSSMQNMMQQQMQMSMGARMSKATGINPMDINSPITIPTVNLRQMPWQMALAVGIEWVWDMLPVGIQQKLVMYFWDSVTNIKKSIMSHKALVLSLCAIVAISSQLFSGVLPWIFDKLSLSAEEKDAVNNRLQKSSTENDASGSEIVQTVSSFASEHPYITGAGAVLAAGTLWNMKSMIKKWFDHNFWMRQGSDMGAVKQFYAQRDTFVNDVLIKEFKENEKRLSSQDSIDHLECIRIVDQSIIENVGQFEMKTSLLNLYLDALRMDQQAASARPNIKSRLNFLFLGNPGTGKTTAAENLFAKMLFATGLRNNKYHPVQIKATSPTIADIEKYAVTAKKGMNNMISTASALYGAGSRNGTAGLLMTAVFQGAKTWFRSESPTDSPTDPYDVVNKGRNAWEKYESSIIASFLNVTDSDINFWNTSAAELLMKDNPAAALNKKVQEMVENDGGVIFIDEAYTLMPSKNKKGAQVYALILLASERHKDLISFILAGYKKDIEQELVSFNPGLARRFSNSVHFEDLSDADIREVINMKLRKSRSNSTERVPGWFMKDTTIDIVVVRLVKRKSFPGFGNFATVNQSYDSAVRAAGARLKLENYPIRKTPAPKVTIKKRTSTQNESKIGRSNGDQTMTIASQASMSVQARFMPAEPNIARKKRRKKQKNSTFQEIMLEDVVGKQPSKNMSLQLLLAKKIGVKNPETGSFGNYIVNEQGFPEVSTVTTAKTPKFIGIDNVKNVLQELVTSAEYNWLQESKGLQTVPIMLNKLFIGKPGTGKTEIAILWAEIIKELHLLSDSSFVSKTASDFIGNVVGGSQTKTNAILKASMGKVLFIDEAYVLAESQFGLEVLNTIVEQVQAKPGADRSVIMAGYPKEMKAMCRNVNPGLGRRFDSKFPVEFHDYSNESLAAIMSNMAKKNHILLLEDARDFAIGEIAKRRPAKDFGNAGTVNTFVDKAVKSAMTRCLESKAKWATLKDTTNPEFFIERDGIKIYGEMKYFTPYEREIMIEEKKEQKKAYKMLQEWQNNKIKFIQGKFRENILDATKKVIEQLEKIKNKLRHDIEQASKKNKKIKKLEKAWQAAKAALDNHRQNDRKEERIQSWINKRLEYLTFVNQNDTLLNARTDDCAFILEKIDPIQIFRSRSNLTSGFSWESTALLYSQILRRYKKLLDAFKLRKLKIKLSKRGKTIPEISDQLIIEVGGPENFREAVEKLKEMQTNTSDDVADYTQYGYNEPEHYVATIQMEAIKKNVERMKAKIDDIKTKAADARGKDKEELTRNANLEIRRQLRMEEMGLKDAVKKTKQDYFMLIFGNKSFEKTKLTSAIKQKKAEFISKVKTSKEILEKGEIASSELKVLLQRVSLADGTEIIDKEMLTLTGSQGLAKAKVINTTAITKAMDTYNKNLLSSQPKAYQSYFKRLIDQPEAERDERYEEELKLLRILEEKKQLFLKWTPSQLVLTKFDFGKSIRPDPIEKLRERRGEDDLVRYITSITEEYKVCKEIWPEDESRWPRASNIIFHGNSGTGKTDSANMLGEALKNAGLLVSGETTIRSASDLEGTVVGEAQKLVQEAMEEALGGILLIDEAYELGRSEYGRQAQTKLIAMLEEEKYNNGKVVVILCGYQDKMQKMMRRNQGMASRFGREFLFKDVEPAPAVEFITRKLREEYFIAPQKDQGEEKGEEKDEEKDKVVYGTGTRPELCLGLFMKFLRESENFGNYRDCKTIAMDIKSNVYANITAESKINTARDNAEIQIRTLKKEERAKKEKAKEKLFAEFYPTTPPRLIEDDDGAVAEKELVFSFTTQNVIDACKQRALVRIRKPKRSSSYQQQENHKAIVKDMENITAENFAEQFKKIEQRKIFADMQSDIFSSVKYDIAREEQMKTWLSLQKIQIQESKNREQTFNDAVQSKKQAFLKRKEERITRLQREEEERQRQISIAEQKQQQKKERQRQKYQQKKEEHNTVHRRRLQADFPMLHKNSLNF